MLDNRIHYTPQDKIASQENLANALEEDLAELIRLSEQTSNLYKIKTLPKKNGGTRTVYAPDRDLKRVLKKINSRIFSNLTFPPYLQGSLSDPEIQRDYINCASMHCGAVAVSHIDIKDFFEHIEHDHVRDVFEGIFNFNDEVIELLSDLVTLNNFIPQGAPTSSYIANMVFYNDEPNLVNAVERMGATYTRLVDDITISTNTKNVSLRTITKKTKKMIEDKDLEINENKSVIQTRGHNPLKVHGVKVVEARPKLGKSEYQEIRRDVHHLAQKAKIPNYRTTYAYYKSYHKVSGKLSILKRVRHPAYQRLRNRLKKIYPLPSKLFKEQTYKKVEKLERSHSDYSTTAWYRKEWNVIQYRLGIIGRTYSAEASQLRYRLHQVQPSSAL